MKKKNLNNAGFTLIELLAVITIMGILMMVAIPAVSRTIENSRRDSFATVAQNYVNSVRNAVLADELTCDGTNVSAVPSDKVYYLNINTGEGTSSSTNEYAQQSADLMESGGNSPWGSAAVVGIVKWEKAKVGSKSHSGNWEYSITLVDTGQHGISSFAQDQHIKRAQVSVKGASVAKVDSGAVECKYTG